jgi:hypothetical protein
MDNIFREGRIDREVIDLAKVYMAAAPSPGIKSAVDLQLRRERGADVKPNCASGKTDRSGLSLPCQ